MDLLATVTIAGLAAYSTTRALARETGPFAAFVTFRRMVAGWRGYSPDADGRWTRMQPSNVPGMGIPEGVDADWIVSGITCPMCLARYVGPLFVSAALWMPYGLELVAMIAAGGVSVALSSRKGG